MTLEDTLRRQAAEIVERLREDMQARAIENWEKLSVAARDQVPRPHISTAQAARRLRQIMDSGVLGGARRRSTTGGGGKP